MSHPRRLVLAALSLPLAACSPGSTSSDTPPPDPGSDTYGILSTNDGGVPPPPVKCLVDGGVPADGGTPADGGAGGYVEKLVYFGDLHLHTWYSLDAFSHGTRTDPATAYQFAKAAPTADGGPTTIQIASGTIDQDAGPVIAQTRPLDFLAVTDHSEYLAVTDGCSDPKSALYKLSECQTVRNEHTKVQETVFSGMGGVLGNVCGKNEGASRACVNEEKSAWKQIWQAAVTAYQPCKFTTLVAYEWSDEPTVGTLGHVTNHRNVIFGSDTVPDRPFDSLAQPESAGPPGLWRWLATTCTADAGCDAVTIPHNTNNSKGVSLKVWDPSDAGVALQQRYQVAAEVYQAKGASECVADAGDPACGFEQLGPAVPGSYIRTALGTGVGYAAKGTQGNPLQLGIVGGTDNHNGAAGYVDEAAYVGHAGHDDDTPLKQLTSYPTYGPGALTGVWAEQNTRDAIFAAIKRRETFATSGPRIQVRFYQTSDTHACKASFPQNIIQANDAVPMGGTFGAASLQGAATPTFAISVWADPADQHMWDGKTETLAPAPIATVQIIKLHADANGTPVEDPPYTVSGIPGMGGCTMWTEPATSGFKPADHAVYYVRVLQQPTWRWSHYACEALDGGPDGCSGGALDTTIQERAWTSPIWYVPGP